MDVSCAGGRWKLVRECPPHLSMPPFEIPISPSEGDYIFGNDFLSVDICLPSTKVSRRHFRIKYRNGIWYVADLKSRNGTFLNGTRIRSGLYREFREGDQLGVGISKVLPSLDEPFSNYYVFRLVKTSRTEQALMPALLWYQHLRALKTKEKMREPQKQKDKGCSAAHARSTEASVSISMVEPLRQNSSNAASSVETKKINSQQIVDQCKKMKRSFKPIAYLDENGEIRLNFETKQRRSLSLNKASTKKVERRVRFMMPPSEPLKPLKRKIIEKSGPLKTIFLETPPPIKRIRGQKAGVSIPNTLATPLTANANANLRNQRQEQLAELSPQTKKIVQEPSRLPAPVRISRVQHSRSDLLIKEMQRAAAVDLSNVLPRAQHAYMSR